MASPILRTEALSFKGFITYPDIVLFRGQVHFIVGESGCGKSTLLKLFNHVLSPDTGRVFFEDRPLEEWNPVLLRRRVSLVAQEAWVFPGTLRENFEAIHALRELPLPEDAEMEEICRICRINFPLSQNTLTLSGGERHRLFMALYLILKPSVLMLDEPTAALDEKNTHEVIGNIIRYSKENGITLIVVSHDTGLLEPFSEHTIRLERGGIQHGGR